MRPLIDLDQSDFAPGIVDIGAIDGGKRQSIGGPGMRAFLNIANVWKLNEAQRLIALGSPGLSTFHSWASKARAGGDLTLPLDALLRISGILGVYKAMKIIFIREADGLVWLSSPNKGLVFGGQSPLALMLSGSLDGVMLVRRYLDAWRGGLFSAPVPGFDDHAPALTNSDVVFI